MNFNKKQAAGTPERLAGSFERTAGGRFVKEGGSEKL
jgi:hypothetical protein